MMMMMMMIAPGGLIQICLVV